MPRRSSHPDRRRSPSDAVDESAPLGGRDVRVELAGHVVRLAELRSRPERYEHWFRQARRHPGHARCLCGRGGQRLVIRQVAGRFHLARWPETANGHVPGCPFFPTDSRYSAAGSHARDAITISPEGTRIAVAVSFSSTVVHPQDADRPGDPDAEDAAAPALLGQHGLSGSTLSQLGLLHYLWERAGLTTWRPGPRRRWADCHAALALALGELRLGELAAPRLLHVVAPYRPGEHDPARAARLAGFLRPLEHPDRVRIRGGPRRGATRHLLHRRLLLGELKDLTATDRGHQLRLRHFPRPVFLSDAEHEHLTRTYPAAFAERRGPSARRVVLALVEGTPHGHLRLADAALILTSSDYLPADSAHEVALADALVTAGRGFTKPLVDGGEAVFPDVVLIDTDPPTVVDIWGVPGRADREHRKQQKRARDAAEDTPVIDWVVTGPMTTFTPVAPPVCRGGP